VRRAALGSSGAGAAEHGTRGAHALGQCSTADLQDSTGENPAAPDITTINVSNDDAGNLISGECPTGRR
jgi:hypothetical protein